MTKEEYSDYLKTDYWKGYSYALIKERGFMCQDCGKIFWNQRNLMNIHHLKYDGDKAPWSYNPEELVCLCRECHYKRHANNQMSRPAHYLPSYHLHLLPPKETVYIQKEVDLNSYVHKETYRDLERKYNILKSCNYEKSQEDVDLSNYVPISVYKDLENNYQVLKNKPDTAKTVTVYNKNPDPNLWILRSEVENQGNSFYSVYFWLTIGWIIYGFFKIFIL